MQVPGHIQEQLTQNLGCVFVENPLDFIVFNILEAWTESCKKSLPSYPPTPKSLPRNLSRLTSPRTLSLGSRPIVHTGSMPTENQEKKAALTVKIQANPPLL